MSTFFIVTAVKTSNFASLSSRLFPSNAKSNADNRPKLLTTKCPYSSLETNQGHSLFYYSVNRIIWILAIRYYIRFENNICNVMLEGFCPFFSVVHGQKYIRIDYHGTEGTKALSQSRPPSSTCHWNWGCSNGRYKSNLHTNRGMRQSWTLLWLWDRETDLQ
jgi:hypothetical protein